MMDDKTPARRGHFLERQLDLPPCAIETLAEQRRFRKELQHQRIGLLGWFGALALCVGVGIATAQEFGLLPESRWWRVVGLGLFIFGPIAIGLSATVSYVRGKISLGDRSDKTTILN